jgi:hypothetical protein
MKRSEALEDLRTVFREFVVMQSVGHFKSDHAEIIKTCSHGIDGDIDYYQAEVRNFTRLDLVDDLAIITAIETFIDRLIDWRGSVEWARQGSDEIRQADIESLERLRLMAQRILRALEKLTEIDHSYQHPILAMSDHLRRFDSSQWTRPKIAKAYLGSLNPSERKSIITEYGSVSDAVKQLAKYLDNHKSELLYP